MPPVASDASVFGVTVSGFTLGMMTQASASVAV